MTVVRRTRDRFCLPFLLTVFLLQCLLTSSIVSRSGVLLRKVSGYSRMVAQIAVAIELPDHINQIAVSTHAGNLGKTW